MQWKTIPSKTHFLHSPEFAPWNISISISTADITIFHLIPVTVVRGRGRGRTVSLVRALQITKLQAKVVKLGIR